MNVATRQSELRAQLKEALEASDAARAWSLLTPHEGSLAVDREITMLWLEMLRLTPTRPSLMGEVELVLSNLGNDPEIVIAANAALLAAASLRAPDEPPLHQDGPAHRAARAAEACLKTLTDEQRRDPRIGGYLYANLGNAYRLMEPSKENDQKSHQAFYEAVQIDDSNGDWWHDLGLLHKWRGRFDNAYAAFLKARARLGETRPVLFNLAICATALGEGDLAGGSFKALGLPVELSADSKLPYVPGLPPAQVRVLSRGAGYLTGSVLPDKATAFEILYVQPLSPCHGVVISPSFRDAPIDYGDLILFDPAPVSTSRDQDGSIVPCFPLLEILNRGDERRMRFIAHEGTKGSLDRLESDLPEGFKLFRQREIVKSARHPERAIASSDDERPLIHGKIVATSTADLGALRKLLEGGQITRSELAMAIPELYELLGDTKRAGQEHQAYRGIERRATRDERTLN